MVQLLMPQYVHSTSKTYTTLFSVRMHSFIKLCVILHCNIHDSWTIINTYITITPTRLELLGKWIDMFKPNIMCTCHQQLYIEKSIYKRIDDLTVLLSNVPVPRVESHTFGISQLEYLMDFYSKPSSHLSTVNELLWAHWVYGNECRVFCVVCRNRVVKEG